MARIGVLAVQGAFSLHAGVLRELGHAVQLVRSPDDFAGLAGLVLPGGESSVQLELLARLDLEAPLLEHARAGRPILATCAGLILLARTVEEPAQRSLGLLAVAVKRNAWGRQLDSFEATADADGGTTPLPLAFIRAPRITAVGPSVEVLARYRGEPVLVRSGRITGATFHPELGTDRRVHVSVFGELARDGADSPAAGSHPQLTAAR